jgi:hypothetical protein
MPIPDILSLMRLQFDLGEIAELIIIVIEGVDSARKDLARSHGRPSGNAP